MATGEGGTVRSTLFTLAVIALVPTPFAAQEQSRTTMPVVVTEVKPEYTDAAKARKAQGTVELAVLVQADGMPGPDVRVVRPLDPDLDQQAIKAARQWRFKPGTKDGQPVAVDVNIEMTFTLRDGPVYKVGEGITAPKATTHPNPRYTQKALDERLHGSVELSGIVETDGSISSIKVVKGLSDDLDQQAIDALKQWRFTPGQKDGVDVRVAVHVEMTFTMK
jgi:TonB family protein